MANLLTDQGAMPLSMRFAVQPRYASKPDDYAQYYNAQGQVSVLPLAMAASTCEQSASTGDIFGRDADRKDDD